VLLTDATQFMLEEERERGRCRQWTAIYCAAQRRGA
jgi:hypothetical protein